MPPKPIKGQILDTSPVSALDIEPIELLPPVSEQGAADAARAVEEALLREVQARLAASDTRNPIRALFAPLDDDSIRPMGKHTAAMNIIQFFVPPPGKRSPGGDVNEALGLFVKGLMAPSPSAITDSE